MSKISELIQNSGPEGVIYKKLVDVSNVLNGYPFEAKRFSKDSKHMPVIRIRDVLPAKASTYYNGAIIPQYIVNKGDILLGMDGNFNLQKWNDQDGLLNQRVCKIFSKEESGLVLNGFLFHLLGPIFKEIENSILGSTVKHLSTQIINKITIPIPPLPVQEEIVRILDSFTRLEAELEAELEARKSQYDYYRNQLLSFEGKEVEWKALGEVGQFVRGNGLQKKDFTETGVGCIHYGQIYTYYGSYTSTTKSFVSEELAKKLRKAEKGDLIIAGVSENIEDVCKAVVWLGENQICVSGDSFVFKHKQNPKFIGYLLQTMRFTDFKRKNAIGAKVTRLQSGSLPKYTIPIPPIAEQERIVSILDKFDVLVNDISTGIPAEIKARRQQYEYYREKLLTFEPISS